MAEKKILMLHGSSDMYGASKIFLFTAAILKDEGHVLLVILSEDGPLVQALKEKGIAVKIVRLGIIRRKYFNIRGIMNRVGVMRHAYRKLKTLMLEEHFTHIYSNTAAVWIGAFLAKSTGITHIWHLHEIIEKPNWFFYGLGKMIDRYADRVIVVSGAVKSHWQKYVSKDKLCLVYNGIDYNPYLCETENLRTELGIPEGACVIGMIGRVNTWKGHEYFLEISKELNKKYLNLYFILVGDAFPGDERLYERLEMKILENQFSERILNLGFRKDISRVLATLDIFALPSILPDPFPTVILEAMASGLPVVATAHGGAMEMIMDGKTGFHIPWEKPDQAANILGRLLEDKNLLEEMGLNAKKRVLKDFSLPSFKSKILKIFSSEVN